MSNTLEPIELRQAVTKILSICEDMRGHLLNQAKDAAESGETNWLVQVSNDARDIDDCRTKLESIGERLREILSETLGFEDGYNDLHKEGHPSIAALVADLDSKTIGNKRLRRVRTSITQGEINQNLLTLTTPRKRGHVRVGEQFKIKLPDGQIFVTDLVQPGNKLRERGLIGEFYRQQKIKAGDYVTLEEIEAGVWTLNKEAPSASSTLPSA